MYLVVNNNNTWRHPKASILSCWSSQRRNVLVRKKGYLQTKFFSTRLLKRNLLLAHLCTKLMGIFSACRFALLCFAKETFLFQSIKLAQNKLPADITSTLLRWLIYSNRIWYNQLHGHGCGSVKGFKVTSGRHNPPTPIEDTDRQRLFPMISGRARNLLSVLINSQLSPT